jgi:hypothetical protein
MSTLFTNYLGKGFKKFANIFWKNNINGIDLGKESNLLSNLNNNKNEGSLIDDFTTSKVSSNSLNSNVINKEKLIPVFWEDKEKSGSEDKINIDLDILNHKNKKYPSATTYNHVISNFRNRIKNVKIDDDLESNKNKIKESKNIENELISNRLKNRVCEAYINANFPREDRSNAIQLKNFDGYFLSVLDGHGGEDVAEYANKELHKKFDNKYMELIIEEENSSEKNRITLRQAEKVKIAIKYAFEQIVKKIHFFSFFSFCRIFLKFL